MMRSASVSRRSSSVSRARFCALAAPAVAAVISAIPLRASAEDVSAPPILQMFESSWKNIENRAPDVFAAGYGGMWVPPPGRADSGNQSIGYDQYDRFDLGSAGNSTLYGTKTGLQQTVAELHKVGTSTYVDMIWNHDGFNQWTKNDGTANTAFLNSGGYPGFVMGNGTNNFGDFHNGQQISGLIDIDHSTNNMYIRNPVAANAQNIPAGTTASNGRLANQIDPNNTQFYPDRNGPSETLFDPVNNTNVTVYHFNTANPGSGDAVAENALGYLMRQTQWMVETIGVDGFRIDAAKNYPAWVLSYYDRAVSDANSRKLLDGTNERIFGFSEIYDGDKGTVQSYIRKTPTPVTNQINGNRDALDFPLYFRMHDYLTNNGLTNDWTQIKNASQDGQDDGLANNGSQGVAFVQAHDSGLPAPYLSNVAYAYTLMRPGNAIVYFNAHEFGTGRSFPIDGRGDALGGLYGDKITTLVDIRNTHGRGNYKDRTPAANTKELLAYEREDSALVLLNNRLDGGQDDITVATGFAPGTPLLELTGNAANSTIDPNNTIPEVVVVNADGTANVSIPRNKNANGVEHDKGYLIYGPSGPQGNLSLSNVAQTLAGGVGTDSVSNGTTRLASVSVIKSNAFTVTLKTNKVNLLGSIRDHDADGDNAMLSIDSGLDVNGNGTVDFRTPGDYKYGYENFTTSKTPGYTSADNNGTFTQDIDATKLSEGYHYIGALAFRHRNSGEPAIFSDFKKTIYIDRLPPTVARSSNVSFDGNSADRDFTFQSTDKTATDVHSFLNLPAGTTDAQILTLVNGNNSSSQTDRDLFKRGFFGIPSGNNVVTTVTYEVTGNYSIQRFTGINLKTTVGAGLGDMDHNNSYTAADVANSTGCFEQVLYSRNAQFNPSGDINGDGKVDNQDLYLLPAVYKAASATAAATEAHNAILRRANINGQFGTDANDITALYGKLNQAYDWTNDLNSDGLVNEADVDTIVHTVFNTEYGDANLDGSINALDFNALASSYGTTGAAWAQGDFNGDGVVNSLDFNMLGTHFGFKALPADVVGAAALGSLAPEPTTCGILVAASLLLTRRMRSRQERGGV